MEKRVLGPGGPKLNPIGLGCMGLAAFYGPPTEQADVNALIHEAIDLGVEHFDTAELYRTNEDQLGEAFAGKRDKIFIATKFGPIISPSGERMASDGSEKNMRRAIEQSLTRLRTDHVDLYYLHRPDKTRPIEETIGAMAKLVEEGKIRGIGLSEASSENIRRGAKVHPIAAIQTEYSIFTRDVERNVLPALTEVGASLVAYSPLGRGMLTGSFALKDASEQDFRKTVNPRFRTGAYEANSALVREIEAVATAKRAKAAQVALAWVLARAPNIHVIPGTTKIANLQTNLGAANVTLSSAETDRLNALAAKVEGERYDENGMKALDTD